MDHISIVDLVVAPILRGRPPEGAPVPGVPPFWRVVTDAIAWVLRARTGLIGEVKLYNLDHVGDCGQGPRAAIAGYLDRYGVEPIHRQVVADQGVEEAMIPIGGSFVQLLGALSRSRRRSADFLESKR